MNKRNAIHRIRGEKKLSHFSLGALAGLHPNTVRAAEYGMATERTLRLLAAALGVSVDVLVDDGATIDGRR